MKDIEREFFRRMRNDVVLSIKKHGLENIIGWQVTEAGIKAVIRRQQGSTNPIPPSVFADDSPCVVITEINGKPASEATNPHNRPKRHNR